MTGHLIAIEGADGCGKDAQVARLMDALEARGIRAINTSEPTSVVVAGRAIRFVLTGHETMTDPRALQLMYAADRLEHVARVIAPALARGDTVVTSRYDLSSYVYMIAGMGEPEHKCDACGGTYALPDTHGADLWFCGNPAAPDCNALVNTPWRDAAMWIENINGHAPRPALTVVLDVPADVCAARRRARSGKVEHFDGDTFQARVSALYRRAEEWLPHGDRVAYVDGNDAPAVVAARVLDAVLPVIGATP
jgi:dTMP kinase